MYIKSNLDNKDGYNYKLYIIDLLGLYQDSLGLAAAKIEVLAFKVHTTPFLAILIVYYSITSCSTD